MVKTQWPEITTSQARDREQYMKNDTIDVNERSASSLRTGYHDALLTSKSNEWYTPARYIEAARQVMGGIDLDPASCEQANQTVKATRYYTKKDNGLMLPWYGRVWCNPPYGRVCPELTGSNRTYQHIFSSKLVQAYISGYVNQAIILLHGYAVYRVWFQSLFGLHPFCLHRDFIPYIRPNGDTAKNGYGGVLVYLGPHEQKFIEVFSQFGRIAKAIDTPKQHINLELWEGVA